MKQLITILLLLTTPFLGRVQTKADLIKQSPLDSVISYSGEGVLGKGNCLFIKFSGDGQAFFNQLIGYHAQEEDQIERSKTTIAIYDTMKPYWVYGHYSVYASITENKDYELIEIYFKAYSNPENYMIHGAAKAYQSIINQLLQK